MSISGYSKISINCRVASKTAKKANMMLQQRRLHAQPPHTTFVTTLMRGMKYELQRLLAKIKQSW